MTENTTPLLAALLNTIVIENKRGTYKNFHASSDYPLKGVTYPTDYGYLPGYLGEDGADLDFFVGSKEDGQSGYIRVARPDTENGETKFFVNTTAEEAEAIGEAFMPVLTETHTYPDRTDILEAIKPFSVNDTKRAAIFHGTGDSPTKYWFPWIKHELDQSGYEVYAPVLPNSETPNKDTYESFLRASKWDFNDNVLVGHSSGATTILNLLSTEWFPHVKAVVLVGTFLNEKLTKSASWYAPGQFDNLFLENYDASVIKQKADTFYFVHGDNDPYCDINDARKLSDEVGGVFITIPGGHHLGGASGRTDLPELGHVLKKDGLI